MLCPQSHRDHLRRIGERVCRQKPLRHFVYADRNGNEANLLGYIREPKEFRKWAALLRYNPERDDDLFVYIHTGVSDVARRVRRLPPVTLESDPVGHVLPLGVLRPISDGELEYRSLAEEREVEGEACDVVEGKTRRQGVWFDRVELAISRKSGFALETRYYRGDRQLRRVVSPPGDIRDYGDRKLPSRRLIFSPSAREPLELVLRNLLDEPEFPRKFFTKHNLRVQRFPTF